MEWLQNFIYGLLSGASQFFPVSAPAHQSIFSALFDFHPSGLTRLLIHCAALLALYFAASVHFERLLHAWHLSRIPRRRRKREPDLKLVLEIRHIRTAFYPLAFGFLFYPLAERWSGQLQWIALFLLLNAVILFIPRILPSGNKDSRSMTALDGFFFGLCSALSVIPGISQMAVSTTYSLTRGAKRENSLNWALMLGVPLLAFLIGFDIRQIVMEGIGVSSLSGALCAAAVAVGAYIGAYLSIKIMGFLAVRTGFFGFSYYSAGASLFAFILYLTI